jgi:hypothetical protein
MRGALVVLSSVATGCVYLTDLSGLSGGADPSDASTGTPLADARVEAGPITTDGGGGPEVGGDGGSPCAFAHAFCADFDVGPLDKGWTTSLVNPPSTFALDDLAKSAPHSFRTTQPAKSTGQVVVRLRKMFAGPWNRSVFEGDFYMEPPSWNAGDSNVAIAQLLYFSDAATAGTILFRSEGTAQGTVEHVSNSPARYVDVAPFAYGRWVHVRIEYDPAGSMRYVIDGVSTSSTFPPPTQGSNSSISLDIGTFNYNNPVPAFDVRWDNVTIDFP